MDTSGRRLAKARLSEGIAGITKLHAMIGKAFGDGIEAGCLGGPGLEKVTALTGGFTQKMSPPAPQARSFHGSGSFGPHARPAQRRAS